MPSVRVVIPMFVCALLAAGCGHPVVSNAFAAPTTATSAGSPATAETATAAPSAPGWVLAPPAQIDGYQRYQPPTSQQQAITSQITSDAAELGVTGTQVSAVYEDRADLIYGVFAGVNGSGFDPASLHAKLWQPPHTSDNGTARVTISWDDTDPGPHGGAAICKQTLTQTGMLAVESTSCYWMSPTTFGEVFVIQDPHAQRIVYDQTAANVGPLMRTLRAAVEHRS